MPLPSEERPKIQIIIDTLKNIGTREGDRENYTLPLEFCSILQLRQIEHDRTDYNGSNMYRSDEYNSLYFWGNPPPEPKKLRHVRGVSWNVFVNDDHGGRIVNSLYLTNQFGVGNPVNDFIQAVRAYEKETKNNYLSEEDTRVLSKPANQRNNNGEIEQGGNESVFVNTEGREQTNISIPRNLIYFGAPGTGKSYKLNQALEKNFRENIGENFRENFERVTFYPTYSYAQFVGTYKPVMVQDNTGNNNGNTGREEIAYQFVPGPFLRVLTNAINNPNIKYCLVIEEINRANAAAVFGDVFQLLDRNSDGESEYSIAASEDIKKYLIKEKKENIPVEKAQKLSIPKNMYIWATMNSADQGVFPMDTAFKRRWSFEYIGIDKGVTDVCKGWVIEGSNIKWNDFRKFVNGLLSSFDVNEDKLMGPYFVKADKKADNIDQISENLFASKVLMYLWEDAARMIRKNIFGPEIKTYSKLVSEWEKDGIKIFVDSENFKGTTEGGVSVQSNDASDNLN